jgi:hypothetical protein
VECFARIECKERNIHLFDNTLEQGGCLDRADAMFRQEVGQHVDFEREFSECIVGNCHPRAKRIVLLP